jgi:expansin (peptidoglycan-binding protein)
VTGAWIRFITPRRIAAGGAVLLAAVIGTALLLQNGGSACAAPPSTSASKGTATFYDLGDGTGNCSFPAVPANGVFVALGPSQYAAGAACGTYLDVSGPKGTVRVKVIDSCPECESGHLDLSRTAFKKIGAEVDGVIPITYKTVKNPDLGSGALSVRIKEGSSQYWFAALIDNHGNRLTSVKVASGGGSFRTAHREDYNYWIIDSGAGPGPYKIKISDVYGRSATLTGITMSPGRTQKTSVRLGTVPKTAKATNSAKAAKVKPTTSATAKTTATPESTTAAEVEAPTGVDAALDLPPSPNPPVDLAAACR